MRFSRHQAPLTGPIGPRAGSKHDSYDERQWLVTEHPLQRSQLRHSETIFTIGTAWRSVKFSFQYRGQRIPVTLTAAQSLEPAQQKDQQQLSLGAVE